MLIVIYENLIFIQNNMQKDKKRRLEKVTKELLNNPLQTTREIEAKTWISKTTVANYINNELATLGQKDERIVSITDKDFELMDLIQLEKLRRMNEEKEKVNNSDIDKWEQTATKRYMLFKWDATDKDWWLNNINTILNQIQGL